MLSLRSFNRLMWGLYVLTAVVHIGALLQQVDSLARATQPLFAPLLLGALLTAVPMRSRTVSLLSLGLLCAWAGDTLGQVGPQHMQTISALGFLGALTCYALALWPLWLRSRDPLRIMLAIPYGAVVIALFVACADGAGPLLPLVVLYAVALTAMAFLSVGGNAWTWMGGTLFLLSSSLLGMDWFLPGATIAYSTELVMLTYTVGHGLLIAGMIRTLPGRSDGRHCSSGAALVIVEP